MLIVRSEFAQRYPVATKRALRAILKAADICASTPEVAASYLATRGLADSFDQALEVIESLPYRRWREVDPEDTLRFHTLWLHEVGMIKTDPNTLIERGSDWRFFEQLKKELKA